MGWKSEMIWVTDLTFSLSEKQTDTSGLTFTVSEGEIFDFCPNGSRKIHHTQKILTGVLKGYGGHVQVFGQELG